ncbi:MAG TPA: hypothetical protein VGE07_05295, partial [Herpetosiphonaceae bacterium]
RLLDVAKFVVLSAALSACGAASSPSAGGTAPSAAARPAAPANQALAGTTCPGSQGPIKAPIVYGAGQNLWTMQPDGKEVTQLTNLGARASVLDPAWSPDRSTLAYTLAVPSADPATMWLQSGGICGIDAATGTSRVLVAPKDPLDILVEASWAPDGQSLVVTKRHTNMDDRKQFLGETVSLVRYTLANQQETELLKDGTSPALSPDGTQIAYVYIDPATYLSQLMIANGDGTNARPAISGDPGFLLVARPRWSPDGTKIVFAALGGNAGAAPHTPATQSFIDWLLGVRVASAHGEPMTIWQVDATGQNLTSLIIGVDDPRITWSLDGRTMLYSDGFTGIVAHDGTTSTDTTLTPPELFWALAWSTH